MATSGDHGRVEELREQLRLSRRTARVLAAAESADELENRFSKADLYEMAQGADISGRSSMTKTELVDALRRVGRL